MRKIIELFALSDDTMVALCDDGTVWYERDRAWVPMQAIPQDDDREVAFEATLAAPGAWLPNGWPIWCVDLNDESMVQIPNAAVFVRFYKAADENWTLVEAGDEGAALQTAKAPGSVGRECVTIDGERYEILSDTIPF